MSGRFQGMSDAHWDVLQKLLPAEPKKRTRGMPHASFRCVLNSIFYVLITGCGWCDLPENQNVFAPKSSAHRWLVRWQKTGVLEALCRDIVAMADMAALLDWSTASVDGSFSPWQRRR
jgi:transposase